MRTRPLIALLGVLGALAGCTPPDGEKGPKDDEFNDHQVVGLAVVLTDHQVQVALALIERGASLTQVHDFAVRIVADFTPARDRLIALAAAQGLTIDQTTVEAQSHLIDTEEDIALIQPPVEGLKVDQVYFADALHDLDKALTVWDNTELLWVSNAALRDELTATRAIFVDALAAGRGLSQQIGIAEKQD